MNREQYMIEIQRTWQDDMSQREQISNATLGLIGEVEEFEQDHVIGELGDVAFYAFTLARLLGHDPREVAHDGTPMNRIAARIAERIKKLEYHRPLGQTQYAICMGDLYGLLDNMIAAIKRKAICGVTGRDFFGEVLAANAYKLRARYPDGFVPGGGVR